MGFFGSGDEISRELGRVLAALDAASTSAVAGLAAVESEGAGVVFLRWSCDVLAGHETVPLLFPL